MSKMEELGPQKEESGSETDIDVGDESDSQTEEEGEGTLVSDDEQDWAELVGGAGNDLGEFGGNEDVKPTPSANGPSTSRSKGSNGGVGANQEGGGGSGGPASSASGRHETDTKRKARMDRGMDEQTKSTCRDEWLQFLSQPGSSADPDAGGSANTGGTSGRGRRNGSATPARVDVSCKGKGKASQPTSGPLDSFLRGTPRDGPQSPASSSQSPRKITYRSSSSEKAEGKGKDKGKGTTSTRTRTSERPDAGPKKGGIKPEPEDPILVLDSDEDETPGPTSTSAPPRSLSASHSSYPTASNPIAMTGASGVPSRNHQDQTSTATRPARAQDPDLRPLNLQWCLHFHLQYSRFRFHRFAD